MRPERPSCLTKSSCRKKRPEKMWGDPLDRRSAPVGLRLLVVAGWNTFNDARGERVRFRIAQMPFGVLYPNPRLLRLSIKLRRAALFLLAASVLLPGQGLPLPHRTRKPADSNDKLTFSFAGVIRKIDDKSLDLEAVDTRFINFLISPDSKLPSGLKEGDPVRVDATQDDKGLYHAVGGKVDTEILKQMPKESPSPHLNEPSDPGAPSAAAAEPPERPATEVVRDTPRYDTGDDGPPKLKHGKATQRASRDDVDAAVPTTLDAKAAARNAAMEPPPTAAGSVPTMSGPGADLIERARDAAANFLNNLPNYVCTQVTTRYQSETKVPNWQALDNISAELVYENGKESYRNLQINNKPTKKSPEESGAWSSGEFGTVLEDLFSPATAADFHFVRDTTTNRMKSGNYDFTVDRPHSHWKIAVQSQFLLPAYQGSVWIEKSTARVLRIEMQATEIPKQFPEDVVETTVDYDYVSLGTEKYLLPVHAELLSCERGSYRCQRNTIDFRTYHKFTGESTIKFNQ